MFVGHRVGPYTGRNTDLVGRQRGPPHVYGPGGIGRPSSSPGRCSSPAGCGPGARPVAAGTTPQTAGVSQRTEKYKELS